MRKSSNVKFNDLIYVAILIGIVLYAKLSKPPKPPACTEPIHYDVVFFGDRWCGFYKEARQFLRDNEIEFCEYDIEQSAHGKALYQGLGKPVFVIKGNVVHQYHEPTILRLVKGNE